MSKQKLKIEKRNGKYVIVAEAKAGQIEGKERFVAVQSPSTNFLVCETPLEAESYLAETGGRIYRLTYYIHSQLEMSLSLSFVNSTTKIGNWFFALDCGGWTGFRTEQPKC